MGAPAGSGEMIAVLIGGTGLTGSFLVRRLLADPAITRVVSVSRKSLNPVNGKLTEVLVSDLAELASIASKTSRRDLFLLSRYDYRSAGSKENFEKVDHAAIVAFAKIAKAHDARSFTLVSAMGANANSMFFYNRVKGRTENDVRALGLRSLIIFRPALLVGPRHEFRLAERIAAKTLVPLSRLLPARIRKGLITEAERLAMRMLDRGKSGVWGSSRHRGERHLASALTLAFTMVNSPQAYRGGRSPEIRRALCISPASARAA